MTADDIYAALPIPDAVSVSGLKAGEEPFVTFTYKLGRCDEQLEALLGAVFGQAKAMSTDGTIKVQVK